MTAVTTSYRRQQGVLQERKVGVIKRRKQIRSRVLLVEPEFPYPGKSKNRANAVHRNFVPIGLLKLGALYKARGARVRLVRGNCPRAALRAFKPSHIMVTSLFTYWSEYVWGAIEHYRTMFPKARIFLGGIYATLHHDRSEFKEKAKRYRVRVHVGLHKQAEEYYPDYSFLNGGVNHHVTHGMRGCIRKCSFCGVWKIEPEIEYKNSRQLFNEIKAVGKNRVIFFDNNFLANHYIRDILAELANLTVNGKPVTFECQSGLDGRLLEHDPELATLLKNAHFRNIRIAWDNSLADHGSIAAQLDCLTAAGYRPSDTSVFMIYNYDTSYEDMLKKLEYCRKWGVQISDCRYRPLDSTFDRYDGNKYRTGQTEDDYYIHTRGGWTDARIRDFRKSVRRHNIWVRYAMSRGLPYDYRMEKWSRVHRTFKFFKMGKPPKLDVIEHSPTWHARIRLMNKIRTYYRSHDMNSLDFASLSKRQLDESLRQITEKIESERSDSAG